MGHLFFTGDTHGALDIEKIEVFKAGAGSNLTKQDILIVTGDTGALLEDSETKSERYLIDWYTSLPFTVAFVDGDYDNHKRLDSLPTATKWGNDVGVLSYSLFHLRRGRAYTINDKHIWTMGGGYPFSKRYRCPNKSRSIELPSQLDYGRGLEELGNNVFDYIVTHTAPRLVFEQINEEVAISDQAKYNDLKREIKLQTYLSIVAQTTTFKRWFFGHFHSDTDYLRGKYYCLYNKIVDEKGNKV